MHTGEKTFEEALTRLEEVVKLLEDGQLPLEKALTLFGEGVELANICNSLLSQAEQRINMLVSDQGEEVVVKEVKLEYRVGGQE